MCVGLLLRALRRKRLLQARHLFPPPSFDIVAPLLKVATCTGGVCRGMRGAVGQPALTEHHTLHVSRLLTVMTSQGRVAGLRQHGLLVLTASGAAAQSGLALSLRNLSTMGAIVFGTTVVGGMGTVSLAAHEILRQVPPGAAASTDLCLTLCVGTLGTRSCGRCSPELSHQPTSV